MVNVLANCPGNTVRTRPFVADEPQTPANRSEISFERLATRRHAQYVPLVSPSALRGEFPAATSAPAALKLSENCVKIPFHTSLLYSTYTTRSGSSVFFSSVASCVT